MVKDEQPSHWYDIEALICFFEHCVALDRDTFLPAYNRVVRLASEVKESGWNKDRDQRCKALVILENEIYEVYPDLFVEGRL